MRRRDLRGCRVLVTGATSGIGQALARQLVDAGARVLATGRNAEQLDRWRSELTVIGERTGGAVRTVAGDLVLPSVRQQLLANAHDAWGGLDGLINNAAVGAIGRFAEAQEARLRQVMEVNFFAPLELTRLALPLLSHGRSPFVANIGSILGHVAMPLKSEYCASKFALRGWSDALDSELAADDIDVLWVAPNTTRTRFVDHLLERTAAAPENPWAMSADAVARVIVKALRRRRRRRILTCSGRLFLAADFLLPRLMRSLLGRSVRGR